MNADFDDMYDEQRLTGERDLLLKENKAINIENERLTRALEIAQNGLGAIAHLAREAGVRTMKEYPLTKDELWTLGLLQSGSALFLAMAGASMGFYLSTAQTIAFEKADKANQAAIDYWSGIGDAGFYAACVCGGIGLILFMISGFKVNSIIRSTRH